MLPILTAKVVSWFDFVEVTMYNTEPLGQITPGHFLHHAPELLCSPERFCILTAIIRHRAH